MPGFPPLRGLPPAGSGAAGRRAPSPACGRPGFGTGQGIHSAIYITCYDNCVQAAEKRRPGRPRGAAAMTAAERMRAYRQRLREKGIRSRTVLEKSPLLAAVRFDRHTLLTPGEQDVLRRFCGGLGRIAALPRKVAVFGSRAKGTAHQRSDLDLAIFLDGARSPAIEQALARLAFQAQAPYREDRYGIFLKPVAFFRGESAAFRNAVRPELEVVWTRPR